LESFVAQTRPMTDADREHAAAYISFLESRLPHPQRSLVEGFLIGGFGVGLFAFGIIHFVIRVFYWMNVWPEIFISIPIGVVAGILAGADAKRRAKHHAVETQQIIDQVRAGLSGQTVEVTSTNQMRSRLDHASNQDHPPLILTVSDHKFAIEEVERLKMGLPDEVSGEGEVVTLPGTAPISIRVGNELYRFESE